MTLAVTSDAAKAVTSATKTAGATLAGNFDTFLKLLTTQMKNQDPTSPLDTNQFTSQLVQFANVEQQINANTNLTTLIDLNRASSLYQASAMVGHRIGVEASQLPLQNGTAALQFTLASPGQVDVSVANPSGVEIYKATVDGVRGGNAWTWNGVAANGSTMPNGAYNVSVVTAGGARSAVPFNVYGTATAITSSGQTPSIAFDQMNVPMSAVRSIIN